ncbi:expressed unknown protein [Seminavis robusta]|uniref:Uncharacterized protein n=1 Tax=Seminavis robusta TaxID=568900 RepID=A0A9N8HTC4_9STRA|nr:expressed unknown protein [Seminavis robusta]|eukprot:Sro1561_g282640.1 n/a (497) ;mRNA; f:17282-18857
MVNLIRIRKYTIAIASTALVLHTALRIIGFNESKFAQNAGVWVTRYRRAATITLHGIYNQEPGTASSEIRVHERHSPDLEIVDLYDWELECIKEGALMVRSNETSRSKHRMQVGKCDPPPELVTDCCESPFSSAGTVVNVAFQKCGRASHAWLHQNGSLQQHAREFLAEMPLPIATGTHEEGTTSNAIRCDVCRIVELSRQHNLTITFVGDSMQAQVWQGLIYELQRRQYRTKMLNNWTQNEGFWKTKIQYRETLQIQSAYWDTTGTDHSPHVTMNFFQVYILPFQHTFEMEEVADSGEVLILGWGLHWNSDNPQHPLSLPSAYVSAMKGFLSFIRHNGTRTQLLVHRETSAQHFDAIAGDYSKWSQTPNKVQECRPIGFHAELSTWRERCVKEAALQAGYHYRVADTSMPPILHTGSSQGNNGRSAINKELVQQNATSLHPRKELLVLPYYNFTAPHYDQHPPEKEADCTHYCPSPFLFLPLWRSLRIVMDRQYG